MSTNTQPLIDPTPPTGEGARVQRVFGLVQKHLGFVPDAMKLYGISPPLLETFAGTVDYFRAQTALPPLLTTLIRYLGSARAGCQFCIDLNEGFLEHLGVDLDQARAARADLAAAPIDERGRTLLRLALTAIEDADQIGPAEMDAARAQGWSDREIFDAVAQAASNRALNHILRTFNVEHQGALA